jgi:hypothetical protein
MSFIPDSNTTLKPPTYIDIHLDSRDLDQYSPYTPYDRSPIERDPMDHELRLLEAGYNASPISPMRSPRSPRSPFEMTLMDDTLLEPAPLHVATQHSRKISGNSIVRTSPTSEAIILTDESDMAYLEEQRRFQIAKARRHGGSESSLDRQEMEILRYEHMNMI